MNYRQHQAPLNKSASPNSLWPYAVALNSADVFRLAVKLVAGTFVRLFARPFTRFFEFRFQWL